MASRVVLKTWRLLRWPLAILALLILLLVGHSAYVIYRFDPDTLPERYGQVDERLYLPEDAEGGPSPLLVLLGGAEGGNAWAGERWRAQRERFLDRGFALLAIGYFGLPNTPEQLDRIALEGIHAAITRAAGQPGIDPSCIGVIGGSRGAELALLLGSQYPEIRSIVAMAPASAVFVAHTDAMLSSAFALNGQPLPFVPMLWSATPQLIVGDIGGVMRKLVANEPAMAAAAIPVERINGPILLVSGREDEMWPATQMAEQVIARLKAHDFAHAHEHWALPGGHTAPLQALERIEGFLERHLRPGTTTGGCG